MTLIDDGFQPGLQVRLIALDLGTFAVQEQGEQVCIVLVMATHRALGVALR